jgi:hypothetical protein
VIDVLAHTPAVAPVLVAHQGGWDEILLIGGPIIAIAALLWVAKKRVDRAALEAGVEGPGHDAEGADAPDGSTTPPA